MKADNPGLKGMLFSEGLAKLNFKDANIRFQQRREQLADSKLATPCLSNIGVISEKITKFGLLEVIDCYIVGPAMFSPGFEMVASTYAGTLTLAINYFRSTLHKLIVDRFITIMLNELRTCAGN
ncbi:MAG: hypothetical protein GYA36_08825 [Veillonellaceae bacterium]|nr:hypothetical protein [Veillonellaceae bacterium]